VFFSAIYTEALFLLAVTGAYWSLITSRYKAAFLWGLVAGLTRPTGLMLAPALLILIWQKRREVARPLAAVGAALAPLAGTILFSIYVYRLSGNPLTWMLGHGAWGRGTREVGAALWAHFRLVASGVDGYVLAAPLSVMNAAAVILALASVIPLIRRGRASYAAFVVLALVPPLAMDGLMSTGRFTSVLFPVFVWIASVTTGPSRAAWMVSFGLGQGLAAVLFYTWRPMY
jgi:hypothetical protein